MRWPDFSAFSLRFELIYLLYSIAPPIWSIATEKDRLQEGNPYPYSAVSILFYILWQQNGDIIHWISTCSCPLSIDSRLQCTHTMNLRLLKVAFLCLCCLPPAIVNISHAASVS